MPSRSTLALILNFIFCITNTAGIRKVENATEIDAPSSEVDHVHFFDPLRLNSLFNTSVAELSSGCDDSESTCAGLSTFCMISSSLVSLLVPIIGIRACCWVSLISILGVTVYCFAVSIFPAALYHDHLCTWCNSLCKWITFSLILWPSWLLGLKLKAGYAVVALLSPSLERSIEASWQAREVKLPGPSKLFYESSLFRKKCEDALAEAQIEQGTRVMVGEFRTAVCILLHDPDWGQRDIIFRLLLEKHKHATVSRRACLDMMYKIAAMHIEGCGGVEEISDHFHVLQLPSSTESLSTVIESIGHMTVTNFPSDRHDVSREEAEEDFLKIQNSAREVLRFLNLKLAAKHEQ